MNYSWDRESMLHNAPRCRNTWKMLVAGALVPVFAFGHACAEPITFRFEGTIGPPRAGMHSIDLPFSFEEGDPISGTFTFEPVDAPPGTVHTTTIQNADFLLKIDSYLVKSSNYELKVADNSISDENPIPTDTINLRCSFGGMLACSPQTINDHQPIEWAFFAAFGGSSGVLSGADLPADPAQWNQLLPGALLVTFSDTTLHKSDGFVATIDSFQIVPEPATLVLLVISCSAPIFVPLRINRCGR